MFQYLLGVGFVALDNFKFIATDPEENVVTEDYGHGL
jgi:hypothetical protein